MFRIRFEGVYKVADVYVNGKFVTAYGDSWAAYTGFSVPLRGSMGLKMGMGEENVIAIHIDASYGTEHWYVGAGIYRHVWLEKLPALSIADNGVYAPAYVHSADSATVEPTVTVVNNGGAEASQVTVDNTLYNAAVRQLRHHFGHISRAFPPALCHGKSPWSPL